MEFGFGVGRWKKAQQEIKQKINLVGIIKVRMHEKAKSSKSCPTEIMNFSKLTPGPILVVKWEKVLITSYKNNGGPSIIFSSCLESWRVTTTKNKKQPQP